MHSSDILWIHTPKFLRQLWNDYEMVVSECIASEEPRSLLLNNIQLCMVKILGFWRGEETIDLNELVGALRTNVVSVALHNLMTELTILN